VLARHIIRGLALQPWLLYLSSGVDIMGGYAFSATRSSISKCVDQDELGKVFAILASMESLVPIGMSQVWLRHGGSIFSIRFAHSIFLYVLMADFLAVVAYVTI
jgi:hypothetical protein